MLKRLLLGEVIDVLSLQETMLSSDGRTGEAVKHFLADCEVGVSLAVGISGGSFLLLKNMLPLMDLNIVTDDNGRFILGDFVVYSWEFLVMCI